MMVILKIPVIALLLLVWWAIRQEPEPADGDPRLPLRRGPDHPRRPRRPRPRPSRRGAHAAPKPTAPARVRAHAKRIERTHG